MGTQASARISEFDYEPCIEMSILHQSIPCKEAAISRTAICSLSAWALSGSISSRARFLSASMMASTARACSEPAAFPKVPRFPGSRSFVTRPADCPIRTGRWCTARLREPYPDCAAERFPQGAGTQRRWSRNQHAFHPDLSAVLLHDAPVDWQPESGAAFQSRVGGIHLLKLSNTSSSLLAGMPRPWS